MEKKQKLLIVSIPGLMMIISIIAFVINTRIAEGKPVILDLSPNILSVGDPLLIKGKNFGSERESSKIYVSSIDILSKYIHSWSDNSIEITIPEKVSSGLVSIETDRGRSEPVVLVLDDNIPFIGTGAYLPGLPFIETIDPSEGGAGSILTIRGDNFGYNTKNSRILFSTIHSRESDSLIGESKLENFLTVSDDHIISWENKEIRIHLPEYATTGDVYIETEQGYSNAVYFEQALINSGIRLQNKRTYMLNQAVSLNAELRGDEAMSIVWFVSPVQTIYQRNIINLPDSHIPSTRSYIDLYEYRIHFTQDMKASFLSHNTIIDIYERNYNIIPTEIIDSYDTRSPLYIKYTESTESIPSTSERIKNVSRSVTRRKDSNFDKTKAIYDYVNTRLTYSDEIENRDPGFVIDSQIGDSQAYSFLFTAMARSSGIPARPVAGILVDKNKNVRDHWWCEFFIQGFGWFPLDPALADGMPWEHNKENPVEYYWGNIDNQHISFNRGERSIPRLFPDGIIYSSNKYSFITHQIETGKDIIELHSLWSDVRITAIY
ncbi:MAG: IPT/TIG domain-containing protein [Spirochaetaceae bacterium]|nr:IPT/TIG domain-containing protein [Spirochaetaceae bacterium]